MEEKGKRTSPRRILEVLEAICADPQNATAAQLSKKLAIPLPTVYRLVDALMEEGFVGSGPSSRLVPGARLRSLVLNALQYEPLVTERQAILKKLSLEMDETVSLSVPQGMRLIYFDRVESHWPFQIALKVGDALPLHCCASGKLYMSTLEPKTALEVFKNINPEKSARNTIVKEKAFAAELNRIRERGFALDDEEWFDGMVGASVPIRNGGEATCAFLSTHSLVTRRSLKDVEKKVPAMQQAARELESLFFSEP